MPVSLIDACSEAANLGAAFARYRRYRGMWAQGVPMWRVTAEPVTPMLALAEELRRGTYRPHPPRSISIAKGNGERRELRVYAIRDRVAQRALLAVLQERTDHAMAPFSYGYRPGRGVADALAQVRQCLCAGMSWVVDADIERCFDSIPRQYLLREVAKRLDDDAAAELVAKCLGWHGEAERCATSIPQGAVLAPWLCNVYLWQLDDAMGACGTNMVRFADDFVLLTASRNLAERLMVRCADAVARLRLRLHPRKTLIVDANSPFRFLGQSLCVTRLLPAPPACRGSDEHALRHS